MKNILKISILVVFSTTLIWFLSRKNLIHFDLIQHAFKNNLWIICGVAGLQILNYIALSFRYKSILNILKLDAHLKNVFAVTFVSNGFGQWFPGSLAFIEVIRVGLLNKSTNQNTANEKGEISRLAMASFFDRLIGLFVGLFIGTLVTIYFMFTLAGQTTANSFILLLTLMFNGLMCLLILTLPLFAGSKLMQHFLAVGERVCVRLISPPFFQHLVRAFFHKINAIIRLFAENSQNYKLFLIPMGLSLISVLSFALSVQAASYALGAAPLSFFVTVAVISILSLMTVLPISIGGIGIPQLITAVLYGAFGGDSANAASAQFLQTGMTLLVMSLCAMCYLPRIIKEMIRPRIA